MTAQPGRPPPEALTQYEAVRLFVERAQASGLRRDERERAGGGGDLRPAGRAAPGHRAGGGRVGSCRRGRCWRGWSTGWPLLTGGQPRPARASRRCRRHRLELRPADRAGAGACSRAWPSSPGAGRWRPPRPCAIGDGPGWRRELDLVMPSWWTVAGRQNPGVPTAGRGRATTGSGCWRRSASTPWSGQQRRGHHRPAAARRPLPRVRHRHGGRARHRHGARP